VTRAGDFAEASDADLIARFLATRDAWAFRTLYRRHAPAVYGLLCRLTGGRESDAADVLQNAWIRAADRLATFRGDAQFRTWLTGIALNCYREWRRAGRAREAAIDSDPGELSVPDRVTNGVRAIDVAEIVNALPPHFREVLVLHDVEGCTHEDIAAALGIEPGTSKSRLSRARALFRAWWRHGIEVTHDR
jgi:RNA polymerase sigma-70 factor (ECF subfamily)